ncbi:MAG TPA: hypothetical protein VN625_11670 [Desulfuromonadaceae bacterium]|nr:hypothetical protein [Desulfuromonadaceae bacterium]
MKKKSSLSIYVISILCAIAQDMYGEIVGAENQVPRVELTIALTNRTVEVGSTISVLCEVQNRSTNEVFWSITTPKPEFTIFLTNSLAKGYKVTPDDSDFPVGKIGAAGRMMSKHVSPGETYRLWELVKIPKTVEPGDYDLFALRYFQMNGKYQPKFKLKSNSVKLHVKGS